MNPESIYGAWAIVIMLKGILLSVITAGIYAAWFSMEICGYLIGALAIEDKTT